MKTRKFWPLDYDPEGEIYENLAWDLPGFRRRRKTATAHPVGRRKPPIRKATAGSVAMSYFFRIHPTGSGRRVDFR